MDRFLPRWLRWMYCTPQEKYLRNETTSKDLSKKKYLGNVVLGKIQVKKGMEIENADSDNRIDIKAFISSIISAVLFEFVQEAKSADFVSINGRIGKDI